MSVADTIGLPFYGGWLAGHSFWLTLVLCLALTPGAMIAIAPIFESRWLPLSLKRQFLSFFPGDILLGLMTAGLLFLANDLPAEHRWYNSDAWHGILQGVTIIVAIYMTTGELKSGAYELRAMLSPTKLYHNGLLYAGYGYVIFSTLVAVLFGSAWSVSLAMQISLTLVPGILWVGMIAYDNADDEDGSRMLRKASFAHDANWRPIWRNDWRVDVM